MEYIYVLKWIDLKDLELQKILKMSKILKSMQAKKTLFVLGTRSLKKYINFVKSFCFRHNQIVDLLWQILICLFFTTWNYTRDGEFSWTVNSRGHFFSKWANSSGHFQRIPLLRWFFVDIFWVNSSGHFLVAITNGANT